MSARLCANAMRSCTRKRPYATQEEVEVAASQQQTLEPLTVYRCPTCAGWHLVKVRRLRR